MIKNEYSRIDVAVIGQSENKRGDLVRTPFPVVVADLLSAACSNIPKFEDSLLTIPEPSSKKYQMIGIQNVQEIEENKLRFHHFKLGYVFRRRDKLKSFNKANKKIKTLRLGKEEYQYVDLHFSIVPEDNTIVIDSRSHTTPTRFFLRNFLFRHLKPTDFGLSSTSQLYDALRVAITPFAREDFDEVLKSKVRHFKEVGIVIAKPSKRKRKLHGREDSDLQEDRSKVDEIFEGVFAKILQLNAKKKITDTFPVKQLRVNIRFEDGKDSPVQFKKAAAEYLKSAKENLFINDVTVAYREPGDELARSFLSGTSLSRELLISSDDHDDHDVMWKEQRSVYFELSREAKG